MSKAKRPSPAQFAAIKRIDSECRRLGVDCCKLPEGIWHSLFWSLYRLPLIETAGWDGDAPLIRLSPTGRSWLPAARQYADTVRVPARFFDDHDERGCEPFCHPVRRSSRFVWLRLDDEGLDELLDDARHYSEPDQFGEWGRENRGLVRSAAATVEAIEKARKQAT